MSTPALSDPIPNAPAPSKAKKKSKKKKGPVAKGAEEGDANLANGSLDSPDNDAEADDDAPESPTKTHIDNAGTDEITQNAKKGSNTPSTNGATKRDTMTDEDITEPASSDAAERLEALAKERDTLRAEVAELRKSLESIQGKHEEELSTVQEQLEESQSSKEHAETQYRNLLGKVNTIKSQLGARMKENQQEIDQAHARIEELEEQGRGMRQTNESLLSDIARIRKENEAQAKEIASLRDRSNLSQQNWLKERDEMVRKEALILEQLDSAKEAMQDWEVVAMEERSIRENLGERVSVLEEQVSTQAGAYEKVLSERDTYMSTVDGLQRALQDIQDARRKELREMVEQSQAQLEDLRKQLATAEEAATASKAKLEETQKELERALPFESQVKEQKLLLGKMHHNNVTLNDHLTKALRRIMKGSKENNVDRQIVTTYILQFLSLDRSDPKKFQVLQLMASLLGWDDEQREQAGLARPGASSIASSLRIPISPFRRTPSTPSLNADAVLMTENSTSKETLAELWSNFLEQEAADGPGSSRRGSTATTVSNAPTTNLGKGSESGGQHSSGPGSGHGLGII